MTTLSTELKHTIRRRLDIASPSEILAIASTLCAQETPPPAATAGEQRLARDSFRPRFEDLDADGLDVARSPGEKAPLVRDNSSGLIWTRSHLTRGRVNWKCAQEAAREVNFMGASDWRLPTIHELLSLVDYERHNPAINTEIFECEAAYYWTSTPAAYSPSVYAWGVNFDDGGASWDVRGYDGFVRAVRAGQ